MSLESVLSRIEAIRSRIESSPAMPAGVSRPLETGTLRAAPAESGAFASLLAQRSSLSQQPAGMPGMARSGTIPSLSPSVPASASSSASPTPSPSWQAASRPAALAGPPPELRPSGALSNRDLRDVLAAAGFQGESLRVAWALARRESGGRPDAVSKPNANGTIDHGLFQVNDVHRGSWIDFDRLPDPRYSAAVAFRMSDGGKNFSAWGLGDTGWAGHLQRTAPQRYEQLQASFSRQYQEYPFP